MEGRFPPGDGLRFPEDERGKTKRHDPAGEDETLNGTGATSERFLEKQACSCVEHGGQKWHDQIKRDVLHQNGKACPWRHDKRVILPGSVKRSGGLR